MFDYIYTSENRLLAVDNVRDLDITFEPNFLFSIRIEQIRRNTIKTLEPFLFTSTQTIFSSCSLMYNSFSCLCPPRISHKGYTIRTPLSIYQVEKIQKKDQCVFKKCNKTYYTSGFRVTVRILTDTFCSRKFV